METKFYLSFACSLYRISRENNTALQYTKMAYSSRNREFANIGTRTQQCFENIALLISIFLQWQKTEKVVQVTKKEE